MAIQHVFSNTVADGTNTNIVRPSDWNSFHNQLSTISGNTLGGSTLSGTNIVLAGGSNITLSATGNTISIIGNSGGGGGGVAVSAGTDSLFTSGTVVFGNTLNGTFATSNGSVIYSNNFLTTAAQSDQVVNSINSRTGAVSFAVGSSLSSSTNGNSTTFGLPTDLSTAFQTTGNYLTSQSNQAASGSNGSFAFQTLSFNNANGVSFGTSAGSAITASYTVPAVTNSSWTVSDSATSGTVGQLAFTNSNGVSFSLSSGTGGLHTIVGSVATNYLTSQSNQAFSAAGGSSAFQTLSFSDNNYGSWTNTGGAVALAELRGSFFAAGNTLTAQNSSGTQNIDAVSFAGSGAISVGVSDGSVVIYAGAAPTVSFAANLLAVNSVATIPVFTNASSTQPSIAVPFNIPNNISFDFVRGLNSVAFNLSIGASTSIATTYRAGLTATHNVHVYSFGTGTNSTVLQYVASTSASLVSSINVNISSTSYSVSQGITYPVSNGTSTFSASYSAVSTSYTVSTSALTALTGVKFFDIPFGTSLSAGNYVFLYGVNNSFSTSGSNMTAAQIVNQPLGFPQVTNVVGRFGVANASSIQMQSVVGSFSTVGGATTASIPLSAVSSMASHNYRYLTLQRQA